MSEKKPMLPDAVRFPLVLGVVCLVSGASLSYLYGRTEDQIRASEKRKLIAAFGELAEGYESFEEKTVELDGGGVFVCYRLFDKGRNLLGYGCEASGEGSYNSLKPIRVVAVIGPDRENVKLLGMRVTFSEETPGLGERIKEKPAANSLWGMLTGRPDTRAVRSDDIPVDLVRIRLSSDGGTYEVEYDEAGRDEPHRMTVPKDRVEILEFVPWFQGQFSGLSKDELKLCADGGKVDAIVGATISSKAALAAVNAAVEGLDQHAE